MKKYLFIATFFTAILGFAQTNIEVDSFSKIKIDANAQVEIIYSNSDKIMFNVDESQLENFTINSDNGMLTIRQNGKSIPNLKIRIYTYNVKGISAKGSGKVSLSKFKYINNLFLSVNGGYIINTGDSNIKNLMISRDKISKAVYTNTDKVTETVDGTLMATN